MLVCILLEGVYMSSLTGKCDFKDHIDMCSNKKDFIKNLNLYLDNIKVTINDESDLIPYYPFLISSSSRSSSKEIINLSHRPFIDMQESDTIALIIRVCARFSRKYKGDKSKIFGDEDFIWTLNHYPEATLILDIFLRNNLTNKVHLFKDDFHKFERYCTNWLVPEYFSDIRLFRANNSRLEWLNLDKDNGYNVTIYDDNKKEFIEYNKDGKYSKILADVYLKMYFFINYLRKENIIK
jgi:hypothetical protein